MSWPYGLLHYGLLLALDPTFVHGPLCLSATYFSIDFDDWPSIYDCLNDTLVSEARQSGTAFPIGGQIWEVRPQSVRHRQDLHSLRFSDERIWMKLRDPNSIRQTISAKPLRIMQRFTLWLLAMSPIRPMTPKPY